MHKSTYSTTHANASEVSSMDLKTRKKYNSYKVFIKKMKGINITSIYDFPYPFTKVLEEINLNITDACIAHILLQYPLLHCCKTKTHRGLIMNSTKEKNYTRTSLSNINSSKDFNFLLRHPFIRTAVRNPVSVAATKRFVIWI